MTALGRRSDGYWLLVAAKATLRHKRMSRELMKAAASPGRTAELTAEEVRTLEAMFPDDRGLVHAMTTHQKETSG